MASEPEVDKLDESCGKKNATSHPLNSINPKPNPKGPMIRLSYTLGIAS